MAVALNNLVTSVTQESLFPTVVDNFYQGNVLLMRLRGKKKMWTGGHRMEIPTEVAGRTALGSYSGADLFDTTQEDVRQKFQVDAAEYYANATITGIQAAANKGKQAVINVVTEELRSIGKALPDKMGDHLYGDGTGNNNKNFTGLVAHVDDATSIATYQGLSRATYSTLNSTRNAQSGALGLSNLAADVDAAQVGSDGPTLIVTTPAVFTIIEALYTSTVTNNFNPMGGRMRLTATGLETGGATGYQGFPALAFRGIPLISDDKCTSGNIFTLNENYLDLYEMEPDGLFVNGSKEGFGWTGWKKPVNQDALVSQILWKGQLVGTQPRKHARRTAVTS